MLAPFAAIAAAALMSGCNNSADTSVPPPSATQASLNNSNVPPELKAQATQQQQMGQAVNQALEQAHEREMASGQAPKN